MDLVGCKEKSALTNGDFVVSESVVELWAVFQRKWAPWPIKNIIISIYSNSCKLLHVLTLPQHFYFIKILFIVLLVML